MNNVPKTQFTLYNQKQKLDSVMIEESQVDALQKAFELFISDQNKHTLRPSELLHVFMRMGLNQ